MTNYHIKSSMLPSVAAQEAKAQRKKLLEEVEKRRRENYRAFIRKQQQTPKEDYE